MSGNFFLKITLKDEMWGQLITTTTTTTTKQNKTHAYFPIYSLSLIFKVTA